MIRSARASHAALVGAALCALGWGSAVASAAEVLLNDGRVLRGRLGMVASLADQLKAPQPDGVGPLRLILFLDDDLRRTFVSKRQVREVRQEDPGQVDERFTIRQRVRRGGGQVKSVGPVIRITPFDEFGRRIFTMNTTRGPVDVVQGITLLTPTWAKVEGISHVWEMRVATSSIPRDTLHKILHKQIDPQDVEHRKKISRFYLQAERYEEARRELEAILEAFADEPDVREDLAPSIRALRQLGARRILQELRLRRQAGQHGMVAAKLEQFPSEDIAGEILQTVRGMVEEYRTLRSQCEGVLEQFDALLPKVKDTAMREKLRAIREEIAAELGVNTLGRMAAFRLHAEDRSLLPEEKLALAVSGWLLGSDAAVENLSVAVSLVRVRGLIRQYLGEPVKIRRDRILEGLRSEEGAVPGLVAGLVGHMKPPLDPPPPPSAEKPGLIELETVALPNEPPVRCLVQLPPEYDPYRRYPAIVTLHGAGTTAAQQIDWWAGAWMEGGWRSGQASRYGYIVIAPQWAAEHQKHYGYSAREHAAVLNCLREACKRFAVDTDRVFLSGHSMGGDAAWDIGLAHPDLWAGVVPVVAKADRYCARYWENAERVPFYFVCGELDGAKMTENAPDFDRYMKHGYNCTVVEYLGRGHEHFYEDILRIFDWMERCRREFFPREFACSTMRPWDNYFWWIELDGLPPRSMVSPVDWPPPRGTQPVKVSAKITSANGIYVSTGAAHVRVWISPQMLDFEQRVRITVNGQRINGRQPFIEPDLRTLLEDVRTRGDRQHPFHFKLETPTGRVVSGR